MSRTYKSLGIVLHRVDWRENDSLFSIYTRNYGKIQVIAMGSKKIKSKLIGHLTSVGVVDLLVAHGRRIDKLAGAQMVELYKLNLEDDYPLICVMFEVLNLLVREGVPDLAVWELLQKSLQWIISTEEVSNKRVALFFFVTQLFKEFGYSPELIDCAICHKPVKNMQYSLRENGVVCGGCSAENKINFSAELQEVLIILFNDFSLQALHIKKGLIREMLSFLQSWVPYVVEMEVRSLRILKF